MKIKEIITEAPNKLTKVLSDCQPYFSMIDDNTRFYRGFKINAYEVEHIMKFQANLKGRVPSDTPVNVHKTINTWFNNNFGHYWRNGVFVTADKNTTKRYGKTFVVVPIGEFDFLYSPEIIDMFHHLKKHTKTMQNIVMHNNKIIDDSTNNVLLSTDMFRMNDSLQSAASTYNEVIFWCNWYYLIDEAIYDIMLEKR